jgi:hypothetical protein
MTMVSFDDLLNEQLNDPDFRDYWERTALARAVANQVIKYRIEHDLSQSALARRLGVSHWASGAGRARAEDRDAEQIVTGIGTSLYHRHSPGQSGERPR